jgi:hypothetical protein
MAKRNDPLMKALTEISAIRSDLKRVDRGLQTVGRYLLNFARRYRTEMANVKRRLNDLEATRH